MLPRQTCPEHRHPPFDGAPGKEEPNTLHRFQAGDEGAIVSEFSTQSRDDLDVFTDPEIARTTAVEG